MIQQFILLELYLVVQDLNLITSLRVHVMERQLIQLHLHQRLRRLHLETVTQQLILQLLRLMGVKPLPITNTAQMVVLIGLQHLR